MTGAGGELTTCLVGSKDTVTIYTSNPAPTLTRRPYDR
jgi:hypothetical protein